MLLNRLPKAFTRVINFCLVVSLIAGAVFGCGYLTVTFLGLGLSGILGGIIGFILGPLAVYLAEVIIVTPAILLFKILVNLDTKLTREVGEK